MAQVGSLSLMWTASRSISSNDNVGFHKAAAGTGRLCTTSTGIVMDLVLRCRRYATLPIVDRTDGHTPPDAMWLVRSSRPWPVRLRRSDRLQMIPGLLASPGRFALGSRQTRQARAGRKRADRQLIYSVGLWVSSLPRQALSFTSRTSTPTAAVDSRPCFRSRRRLHDTRC